MTCESNQRPKFVDHIVYSGYYGMRNFGDDIFGIMGTYGQRLFWPDMRSSLLSPPIDGLDAKFIVSRGWAASVYSSHSSAGKAVRLAASLYAASISDRYIYCGGSIFTGGGLNVRGITERVAGRRLSAIGVSVGPFKTAVAARQVTESLKKFEFIAVRDRSSFETVADLNLDAKIVLAADLAGLIPRFIDVARDEESFLSRKPKILGFSPCMWDPRSGAPERYCDEFLMAVDKLNREVPVSVRIIILNEHPDVGDVALAEQVAARLRLNEIEVDVISYRKLGVEATLRKMCELDAYVSARLHGAIAAFSCGIPFVLEEYHRKCSDFLSHIGQHQTLCVGERGQLLGALFNVLTSPLSPRKSVGEFEKEAALNFSAAPWYSNNSHSLNETFNI